MSAIAMYLAIVVGFVAPARAAAPLSPEKGSAFDQAITQLGQAYLSNGGVGLSMGVVENGREHFYHFGSTTKEAAEPPTDATVYEIASLTKTFTGLLLAQAIVEEKVRLNDVVSDYLGDEFPNLICDGESLRIVHLANMTSGIPNEIPAPKGAARELSREERAHAATIRELGTRADFLRDLHMVTLTEQPGVNPGHSNAAAQLLGYVVENVDGSPLEDLVPRLIERPLEMGSGDARADRPRAKGYGAQGEEVAPSGTASGLRYSTADMLKYAAHQLDERDAAVALSHKSTWDTPDKQQSIGFFWIVSKIDGGRRLRYSGSTPGFTSFCDLYPEQHVGIVLLANNSDEGAQDRLKQASEQIDVAIRH